jgi:8-oxo-dGTP pyrophosphatase MutT (NUDIX family)
MTDPAGEIRPIVRVLLLDFDNRLLLLRGLDPVSKVSMWFPVGGGVEPGEDPRQAGTREIAEETGLLGVELGPEVWRRQQHYCWQGKAYHSQERWFLTRVQHYHPCFVNMPPDEQDYITGSRWWTVTELHTTPDTLAPSDLANHLQTLLRDGEPAQPIELPDTARRCGS